MKMFQIILSLLLFIVVFSSCRTSQISYKRLNDIQYGMSSKEVIAILGKPEFRNFDDKGESLEFYSSKLWAASKVVQVWFIDDKVVKMNSHYYLHNDNCSNKTKDTEKKEENTHSGIRMTTDGQQLIQQGSVIQTPDGTTEIVVSDHGGLIITSSGKHIQTY